MELGRRNERNCCALVEFLSALLATVCYAGKVCVTLYSWWGDPPSIALKVSLSSAFRAYHLSISPRDWTYCLWLLLVAVEGLWITQAWVLVTCKRHTPRIVFPWFYPAFSFASLLHMGWVFAWARLFPELALALITLLSLTLVACVAMVSGYLYYVRGNLKFYYTCTFRLTRLLVLNGTAAYATLSIFTTLFTLGAVLVENAGVLERTASTVLLSLLSSLLITYFLLENTILDRFLRYVFAVYPVVLWTLAGVLVQNWDGLNSDRNQLFTLVLACVTGLLILIRAILCGSYLCSRPLPDYEKEEPEVLPLGQPF